MLVLLQNKPRAPSRARKTYLFDAGAAKCLLKSGNSTTDWLKVKYQGWGSKDAWMPVCFGSIKCLILPSGVFQPPQCPPPKVLLVIRWIWAGCRELRVFPGLCFSASSQLGLRSQWLSRCLPRAAGVLQCLPGRVPEGSRVLLPGSEGAGHRPRASRHREDHDAGGDRPAGCAAGPEGEARCRGCGGRDRLSWPPVTTSPAAETSDQLSSWREGPAGSLHQEPG